MDPRKIPYDIVTRLNGLEKQVELFPMTVDAYYGKVMLSLAQKVIYRYSDLFASEYFTVSRDVIKIHNFLCNAQHDDDTTLCWSHPRRFFIILKILAAKLNTLFLPYKSTGITISSDKDAKAFNTAAYKHVNFQNAVRCQDSYENFLKWTLRAYSSLPSEIGKRPMFKS